MRCAGRHYRTSRVICVAWRENSAIYQPVFALKQPLLLPASEEKARRKMGEGKEGRVWMIWNGGYRHWRT